MRIAVLAGGISPERNVSLTSGKSVYYAIKELGHDVVAIDPALGNNCIIDYQNIIIPEGFPDSEELSMFSTRNIIECVNSDVFDNIDIAFIVLHGKNGEDGKIQSLLELRGIPYTGSGVKASSLAIDKLSSKMLFMAAGLPTPPWSVIRKEDFDDYDNIEDIRNELGKNIIIKPNDQGSTIGITRISDGNLDDIHQAILEAGKYSDIVLAESFIEGLELTVGIVGDEALPVIEIIPESGFFDYEHKYKKGKTVYECPADIYEEVSEFLKYTAITAFRALGCKGFGRADFRMDDDGRAFCLEVNTIPGFTSTSLVPMAAKESGIEFNELCQKIIDLGLEK